MFDWATRLMRVAHACEQGRYDALVITTPVNVRYLTGFSGSAGLLVCTPQKHTLVTDGRYESFVREEIAAGRLARIDLQRVESRYDDTLIEIVKGRRSA